MKILKRSINKLKLIYQKIYLLKPETAYDILSEVYDTQHFNLLHKIDKDILQKYENQINSSIKNSLDFGSGTGRNIPFLRKLTTDKVFTYDISSGMISKLKDKFPYVIITKYDKKLNIQDKSIDLIICNLTIGYINDIDKIFKEWDRILNLSGKIIITDLHQSMNKYGFSRNFIFNGKKLTIKSKNHSKLKLNAKFRMMNWQIRDFNETIIDDSIRKYFNEEHSYKTLFGKKLLYSYFLEKIHQ